MKCSSKVDKAVFPKVRHWKSLFQHLVTYPAVKAFVVALFVSTLSLARKWLTNLDTIEIFVGTLMIAWGHYIFSYSLKSKRYHFYEEGQFNIIHSQNVRLIRISDGKEPFGHRLEFQVDFYDEMASVPTFRVTNVQAQQGVAVSNVNYHLTDRKRATFEIEVDLSPFMQRPEMSVAIIDYVADATDSTVPGWFKWIYKRFPGKH